MGSYVSNDNIWFSQSMSVGLGYISSLSINFLSISKGTPGLPGEKGDIGVKGVMVIGIEHSSNVYLIYSMWLSVKAAETEVLVVI